MISDRAKKIEENLTFRLAFFFVKMPEECKKCIAVIAEKGHLDLNSAIAAIRRGEMGDTEDNL